MKKVCLVGIDVSAKTLEVALKRDDQIELLTFDNTLAGHKKLVSRVTKRGYQARVCIEATGVYHMGLALHLSKATRVEIMVLNPRAAKHYSQALMQRSKTDKVDAKVLLSYVERMVFQLWKPPSALLLELQALVRRIQQLSKESAREKNRLHSEEYKSVTGKVIARDIEVNIRHLAKRVMLLEGKALDLVKSSEPLEKTLKLLVSITGVAQRSGLQLLSELMVLPKDMSAPQWVAHAGLDPRAMESGSSLNKPRRISKVGNKYLRTALFMPALVAIQRDAHVSAFYNKLIAAGKEKMQAIIAVMRKLLHAIWGMLKSSTPWQSEKFYFRTDS